MRTPKCRRVCLLPKCRRFQSFVEDSNAEIERKTETISITEFETVRLLDYVGLTQEEAARQMNVGRTTVQRLYKDARRKLATFLVEGLRLNIEGGVFELCGRDRAAATAPPVAKNVVAKVAIGAAIRNRKTSATI